MFQVYNQVMLQVLWSRDESSLRNRTKNLDNSLSREINLGFR